MQNKLTKLFIILVISIQLIFILGTVYSNEKKLKSAKEIIVKLAPLDPRSIMQGDYVVLDYDISRAAQKAIKKKTLKKIKVVLSPQNNLYVFDSILSPTQNIILKKDQVVMNGKITKRNRVHFGIENFFVEEGTGLEIERKAKFATLKVTSKGDAFITKLLEKVPEN